ncbi:MFS multidrug transporter [Penicillium herquei]|nr:MFS multidrug transporter [Penicillium herquei]
MLALFGYFADHCTVRRTPFVLGMVAFAGSITMFVLARSLPVLIIARALQGLSAAAVWVVGLALIADNVATERVGEAMGYTGIALTWGFLLGPSVGGIMYDSLGFYGTFAIPIALLGVDVILRLAMIEKSGTELTEDHSEETHVAYSQSSTVKYDIGYNTFSSQSESTTECSSFIESAETQTPLLGSLASDVENMRPIPQKKATIFNLLISPDFLLRCYQLWSFQSFSMQADLCVLQVVPLFVMNTFHWTSAGAGLMFMIPSIPSFAGVYIGRLHNKIGPQIPGAAAFLLAAVTWMLMPLIKHNNAYDAILLVILLLFKGLAVCTVQLVAMTEVFHVIEAYEAEFPGAFGEKSPIAQGYALFNVAMAAGQLLGPLLAGSIKIHAGWGAMSMAMGLVCALASGPFILWSGKVSKDKERAPVLQN